MTTLSQAFHRGIAYEAPASSPKMQRAFVVALFAAAVTAVPGSASAAANALADAYLAVSVFVAGTITLVLAAERGLGTDLATLLRRYQRWHVPAGTILGSFPGCGGAIVAITQFTRGHLSFGGVVATLIATMGDAMFLLMAREPLTAIAILALSASMGLISGYAVDAIHGPDFLRPRAIRRPAEETRRQPWAPRVWRNSERLWIALVLPGVIIGLLSAFQIDLDEHLPGTPAMVIGMTGALLALGMWIVRGGEAAPCGNGACEVEYPLVRRIIDDTNFVSSWVIFAFMGYEILVAGFGLNLAAIISTWGPLVPAMAILVGFIPGCGPQIMVTSLYVTGSLPLSAQIGNAISNDGDALFPAIAIAPKAAIVATLYSAIPALLAAYGWHLLFEVQ